MTDSNPKLCLTEYGEKAVVVHGTATKEYKESIKALGGKWCASLKGNINSGGWVFPKKCKDTVDAYVTKALESGAIESLLQWAQENTLKKAKKQSSVTETTSPNVSVNAATNLHEVLVRIAVALEENNKLSAKIYALQKSEYQRDTTTEPDDDDCDVENKKAKEIEEDLQPTSEEESEDSDEEEEIPAAPVDVKPKRRLLKGPKTVKRGTRKVVKKVVKKKKRNNE